MHHLPTRCGDHGEAGAGPQRGTTAATIPARGSLHGGRCVVDVMQAVLLTVSCAALSRINPPGAGGNFGVAGSAGLPWRGRPCLTRMGAKRRRHKGVATSSQSRVVFDATGPMLTNPFVKSGATVRCKSIELRAQAVEVCASTLLS